jgi:hypothetical protein
MPSTLFGNQSQPRPNNAIRRINDIAGAAAKISGLVGMLRGQNGNDVAANLAKINPQFREFYQKNWDKPIEQIAAEYGLHVDDIKSVMEML